MQDERSPMERKVSFSWLLSFYGALLTENQQEISRLYAEEDLSMTEIADQFSVSRQSVYDTVHRTEKQLLDLESKLGMRKRFEHREKVLRKCIETLKNVKTEDQAQQKALLTVTESIQKLLEEEENDNGL